ncbi:MAG: hypothetical protein FWG05_06135, partial [Kiritimatiellaeota bacterium]|nr:hypothetical protein [Kiritimatiellota bacterium]
MFSPNKKNPRLRFNKTSAFSRHYSQRGMTRRGRSGYVDNAPGRLFKYMSAGGVERSSDNYD